MKVTTPPIPDTVIFMGKETNITLPTGRVITIRETNGDDDELLSKVGDAQTGDNVYNFLASIITMDKSTGKKPLVEDIMGWPINDKYYVLFKQRIINQGPQLKFPHECSKTSCNHIAEYEEDLDLLDKDLSAPNTGGELGAKRYPNGNKLSIEFELTSGKKLKYKILTGILEKKQLDIAPDEVTKNTRLSIRELEIKGEGGEWKLVTHFGQFSSKEMNEIRNHVNYNDPAFDPITTFSCPKCSQKYVLPILSLPSFYFPEETI